MDTDPREPLALSVVMPVRDGADFLRRSLPALRASDLPSSCWELIVADDGSRDDSAAVAAQYADRVVRLAASGGSPPTARNRGLEAARAPLVVFVDADVCVHPDALRKIRDLLTARPDLSAVFGAYDLSPAAPSLVSQYRNLLHSYVHRREAGEAVTFWTGLGGVRRAALDQCGGLDERERLDDVELGYRLTTLGHRIEVNPDIQGTHLKRWTLANLIATDVLDRGIPWVRLLLRRRQPRGRATLNVRGLEQLLTALMGVAIVALAIGLARGDRSWLLGSAVAAAAVVGADWRFLGWLAGQRGWLFTLGALPLRVLYFALNVVSVGLALIPVDWRRPRTRRAAGPGQRVWTAVPSRDRPVADLQPPT